MSAGFEVEFEDPRSSRRRGPLSVLWSVRFEDVNPVRTFPLFKGQKNHPGERVSASTGRLVGYESQLEKLHAMLLDFDPRVTAYASQPFWLHWTPPAGSRPRKHAPDYFARMVDGSALVLDVRDDQRIKEEDAEAFEATERACAEVGWQFRRAGAPDPVFAANVRWLAGYRRRFCLEPQFAEQAAAVFANGKPLFCGAQEIGDRRRVLPTLCHLMWRHVLVADLGSAPLGPRTVIALAPGAAP